MEPIYSRLHEELIGRDLIHADEVPCQVLHEDGRKATQKSYMWIYQSGSDGKSPVYAKDEKQTRYNVEMLLTGEDYTELPNTYVIFICDFDPFGKDKYRYTFRTTCQESENVDLEDGRTIVFLNTRGKNESEVPGELVTFLQYMKEDLEGSEKEFHDPYVEQLQKFIRNVKGSREMEERFMIFEEMLKEERAAGFAKGRAEGVVEGRISESKDTLLLFLQNLGTVPKVLSDQIEEQGDLDVLKEWIELVFKSKSVEEFAKKIK